MNLEVPMRRLALYLLVTCLITEVLYQRHVSGQVNTVKELALGVYFHERPSRERALQQWLGDFRRLRTRRRRELSVRRAGNHPRRSRRRRTNRSASRSIHTTTAITHTPTRSGWTMAPFRLRTKTWCRRCASMRPDFSGTSPDDGRTRQNSARI